MPRVYHCLLPAIAFAIALGTPPADAGTMVDTKLSLVIDISGSVNTSEYNLQMDAYADAFRTTALQDLILGTSGQLGKIAVNTVFFATSPTTNNPFTILDSAASIDAYAQFLDDFVRPPSGTVGSSTQIAGAMTQSTSDLLDDTIAESNRLVMDVSGDGTDSDITGVRAARDNAILEGITINGIAITTGTTLGPYFEDNVVTPDGRAFVVDGFAAFQNGIREKLRFDIGGGGGVVPEPSAFLAWSMFAMLGCGGRFRRRRRTC